MRLMGFLSIGSKYLCIACLFDPCSSYSLPHQVLLPTTVSSSALPMVKSSFISASVSAAALYANNYCKSALLGGIVTATIATSGLMLSTPAMVRAETFEWELMNGSVVLKDPMVFQVSQVKLPSEGGRGGIDETTGSSNKSTTQAPSKTVSYTLSKPKLIGAGGGGAVFSFENSLKLLKVSWEGSAKSVERECSTLQMLERNEVEASERCLGKYDYNHDDAITTAARTTTKTSPNKNNRIMILAEPYVPDGVASVMEVDESKRDFVVEQIARTLIQMLAANIVTIDVQPLISKETGRVIFIDMTEAQQLKAPFTFLAKALMSSFTTEMIALIPEKYMSAATHAAMREIQKLEARGVVLTPEAVEVLKEQTSFIALYSE